jgi:hypothetical protein
MENAPTTSQTVWSVVTAVRNVEGIKVGRERKARPFIERLAYSGTDIDAALDVLADLPSHASQLRANGAMFWPHTPEWAEYQAAITRRQERQS